MPFMWNPSKNNNFHWLAVPDFIIQIKWEGLRLLRAKILGQIGPILIKDVRVENFQKF